MRTRYDVGHGAGRRAAAARGPARGHADAARAPPASRGSAPRCWTASTAPGCCCSSAAATTAATRCTPAPGWPAAAPGSRRCCSPTGCTRPGSRRCGAAGGRVVDDGRPRPAPTSSSTGSLGIGGRGGLRDRQAAVVAPACRRARWWSPSTCRAVSTRRPARSSGVAVRADVTVTFGALKTGPGRRPRRRARRRRRAGRHRARPATGRRSRCCRPATSAALLPRPARESDKYRRGVVGVAAGSDRVHRRRGAVHRRRAARRCRHGALRRAPTSRPALVRARWPEVVVGGGPGAGLGGRVRRRGGRRATRLQRGGWPTACRWSSTPTPSTPVARAPRPAARAASCSRRTPASSRGWSASAATDVEARRLQHARAAARELGRRRAAQGLDDRRRRPGRAGAGEPDRHRRRSPPPAPATCWPGSAVRCSPAGSTRSTPARSAPGCTAWPGGSPRTAGRRSRGGVVDALPAAFRRSAPVCPERAGRLDGCRLEDRVSRRHADARVDLGAIRDNVAALRAGTSAEVMAVVKADGYGHGLVPVGPGGRRGRRRPGWAPRCSTRRWRCARPASTAPRVLAWLLGPGRGLRPTGCAADVDLSVNATWALDEVRRRRPRDRASRPGVHLKVDTGLGRGGAALADWPDLVEAARKAEAEGAVRGRRGCGRTSPTPTRPATRRSRRQAEVFRRGRGARRGAPASSPEVRHLANSAATLTAPDAALRPGAARASRSTGCRRCPEVGGPSAYGLRPAMTLAADVVLVKRVPAGSGVCYGHTLHDRAGDDARAGAARLRRRRAARSAATSARCWRPAGAAPSPAGSAWTSSCSTSATTTWRPATRSCCSAPATTASRPRRTGRTATGTISYEIVTRVGPRVPGSTSTRRVDRPAGARGELGAEPEPARVVRRRRRRGRRGGCRRRAGRRAVRRRAARSGRRTTRRPTSRSARCADPWSRSPPTTACALHVEVDGPPLSSTVVPPVTVVFCHGLALSQDSWHYQRRDLADLADDGCRLVFWDQRGHGRVRPGSGGARDHRPARPRPAAPCCEATAPDRAGRARRPLDGRHDDHGAGRPAAGAVRRPGHRGRADRDLARAGSPRSPSASRQRPAGCCGGLHRAPSRR